MATESRPASSVLPSRDAPAAQPIPRLQHRPRPDGTRNNLPIMLDRHPVPLQPKFADKLLQADRLR